MTSWPRACKPRAMATYGCRSPSDPRVVTTIRRAVWVALGSPIKVVAPFRSVKRPHMGLFSQGTCGATREIARTPRPTIATEPLPRADARLKISAGHCLPKLACDLHSIVARLYLNCKGNRAPFEVAYARRS